MKKTRAAFFFSASDLWRSGKLFTTTEELNPVTA